MGRACSRYGAQRNACRVLGGNPEGKRPLENPKLRGEDKRNRMGGYELDSYSSG
jgi:hypothetical protein